MMKIIFVFFFILQINLMAGGTSASAEVTIKLRIVDPVNLYLNDVGELNVKNNYNNLLISENYIKNLTEEERASLVEEYNIEEVFFDDDIEEIMVFMNAPLQGEKMKVEEENYIEKPINNLVLYYFKNDIY